MFAAVSSFVRLIGYLTIWLYLYEHLRTPFWLLWRRLRNTLWRRPSLKERFGSWAAVTGSSDGIGKAYAIELARQGLNIVLIDRNLEKMTALAKEIVDKFQVETKSISVDFTDGVEIYAQLEQELEQLPIGIFVNNVGIGVPNPSPLWQWSREQVQHMIETNVVPVSQLTRFMFQHMQKSGIKGAIVNISSALETQPLPNASPYAASKVFTRYLTLALQYEARNNDILVQLISPDFVMTTINSFSTRLMSGGLFIPPAEVFVRSAVWQLREGVLETPGYLWHHLINAVVGLWPQRIRMIIVDIFLKLVAD